MNMLKHVNWLGSLVLAASLWQCSSAEDQLIGEWRVLSQMDTVNTIEFTPDGQYLILINGETPVDQAGTFSMLYHVDYGSDPALLQITPKDSSSISHGEVSFSGSDTMRIKMVRFIFGAQKDTFEMEDRAPATYVRIKN